MGLSKIFVIAVSLAVFQYVEAATKVATKPNPKYGCPPINPLLRCIWYNKQCDVETNSPCSGSQICCGDRCGTQCKTPTYIQPSPIEGCPPINTDMYCFWYNEQCNDSDKLCPAGSICCGDNCGTFCEPTKPLPVEGCPPIDENMQCIWYNEQCNEVDKLCPANSICCKDQCGSQCVTSDGATTTTTTQEA